MKKASICRSGRRRSSVTVSLFVLTALLLLGSVGASASISAVVTTAADVYPTAQIGTPIVRLSEGTQVLVLSLDVNWAALDLGGGETGYVLANVLGFGTSLPAQTQASFSQAGETAASFPRVETAGANAAIATPNRGALNLRAYPDPRANVTDSLANGSRIRVMAQREGWYYVQAGSQTGYMAQPYLQLDDGVQIPASEEIDGIVQKAAGDETCTLRKTPEDAGESLGEYPNGTYVRVMAVGAKWLHVFADGQEGYMLAPEVHIVSPNATSFYTVTTADGNAIGLYERPSVDAMSLASVPNGAMLIAVAPQSDWYEVQYIANNEIITGYVQSENLTVQTPYLDEMDRIPNG